MRIMNSVLQILYPLRCPVCDDIVVPAGRRICPKCIGKLTLISAPYCRKCGKQLLAGGELCRDCTKRTHVFAQCRILYQYETAQRSVYRFKYSGRREYGAFYGEQMVEHLGDYIRKVNPEAIVPVPLHAKRLKKRGYNQSLILAKEIERRMGIPLRTDLIKRVKNTNPLKYENPGQRENNLKKAFIIGRNDVKLNRVLLVDDIYTTGRTMDAVATALYRAGTKEIYGLCLTGGSGM